MARSANQKMKLLVLKDYLLRNSDENHPVTIAQMIEELTRFDIRAERKSIYDDLETLRLYGLDIIQNKGQYYVGQRHFEIPELKLLVDSVQSSKFITRKKTMALIKKQMTSTRAKNIQSNSFWLGYISGKVIQDEPIIAPSEYDNIVNSVTKKEMVEFMKKYFHPEIYTRVDMHPTTMQK